MVRFAASRKGQQAGRGIFALDDAFSSRAGRR